MEQSPILGIVFHARVMGKQTRTVCCRSLCFLLALLGLLSLLLLVDYLFVSSTYAYTVTRGASVQIVFGFEV